MKALLAIALALHCLTPITVRAASPPTKDVSALLAPIVQKHDVPGMAAAVVRNGETVALGVAGVRTRGKPDKVATADRFHIGSDTKAMTAMLCGILASKRDRHPSLAQAARGDPSGHPGDGAARGQELTVEALSFPVTLR